MITAAVSKYVSTAPCVAEAGGKRARRNRRRDAVNVGRADAERDQREHVRAAIDDRRPAALEERPAAPRARPASPARARSSSPTRMPRRAAERPGRANMSPIASTTTGSAERRAPIQKRRVMSTSSGFGASSSVSVARLERHAAVRARARLVAHDLRMHRAGLFDFVAGPRVRLQRHAALRAWPRILLPNLRVHRADVGGAGWLRCRRRSGRQWDASGGPT